MSSARRAVVRNALGMRLVGVVPGVFFLALSWTIVDSVVHGDPARDLSGVSGPVGTTIAWLVVLTFWFLTGMTVLVLAGMREVFTPEGVSVRAAFRSRRLALADVKEVRVTQVGVHTGSVLGVIPLGRIAVDPEPGRSRVRAVLNAGMSNTDEAMSILDEWVRARPDIIRQDEARELFRSRGALAAQTG